MKGQIKDVEGWRLKQERAIGRLGRAQKRNDGDKESHRSVPRSGR